MSAINFYITNSTLGSEKLQYMNCFNNKMILTLFLDLDIVLAQINFVLAWNVRSLSSLTRGCNYEGIKFKPDSLSVLKLQIT